MPAHAARRHAFAAVLALSLAVAAGCSKGSQRTPEDPMTVLDTELVTSAGAEIVLHTGDPTTDGMSVSIPAGALRVAQETITISTRPTPPASLRGPAVAAGAVPVSATFGLSKTTAGSFASVVEVTIPYDATIVGTLDVPVVLSWSAATGRYAAAETARIDDALGLITVRTRHLSVFTAFTIPGLGAALGAAGPDPRGATTTHDTGFRPSVDGFAVETFSTQADKDELDGNCYAPVIFASWYYDDRRRGGGPALFEHYRFASGTPGSIPQRDDVARELLHHVFLGSTGYNKATSNTFWNGHWVWRNWQLVLDDAPTLAGILSAMILTDSPQILALSQTRSPVDPGYGHSVLAYRWDPGRGLDVYDPDWAASDARTVPWTNGVLGPYFEGDGVSTYARIGHSATGTFFDDRELLDAALEAEADWPNKAFASLTVASPTAVATPGGGTAYPVDPGGVTTFQLRWSPPTLWRGTRDDGSGGVVTYPRPSFAHVYRDGAFWDVFPVTSGAATFQVPSLGAASSALLEVAISNVAARDTATRPGGGPQLGQTAVSAGYEGFLRVQLVPRQTCRDVSGAWHVLDTATISCSGVFGSGTDTETGSGTITMTQSGCDIGFMSPMNTSRTGTLSGNAVHLWGAAAVVDPAVTVTRNRIDFSGTLSADGRRIDLTGTGSVEGSYQGDAGECTVASVETLTR